MTGGPSAGPASAYPTLRRPASICFSGPNEVFVPGLIASRCFAFVLPDCANEEPTPASSAAATDMAIAPKRRRRLSLNCSDVSIVLISEFSLCNISGNVRGKYVVLGLLRCMADKTSLDGVGSVGDLWFRGVASEPYLESPSTGRWILLGVFHHHRHKFLGAFGSGAILHRQFVNVVRENGSVRIRKCIALFKSRQAFRIHVDNVQTIHAAENRAILGCAH